MTTEELDFIDNVIDRLEKKNERISSLLDSEKQLQLIEQRDKWHSLYKEVEGKLNFVVRSLKEKGYITDEVKALIEQEKL